MPVSKTKNTPAKKSKPSAAKPKQKEVIYPILLECAAITKDEFWIQFFQDMASGKASKGVWISHGVIQSSNKRNGFSYSIADKAPEVIVAELHHLITTHTSICSRKDAAKKKAFVDELDDELTAYDEGKWTSIKRKNIRMMLLVDYAIQLQRAYNLGWLETISAYRTIVGAFESKTHTSKDVNYEDGKIISIDDIEFNEDETSIVNTRIDNVDDFESKSEIPERKGPYMLHALFEFYVAALMKSIK